MALDPSVRYSGQVDADAGYPFGKARNRSTPGDTDGTPWERDLVNDIWGFLQSLLDEASITPSEAPDEVGASDYFDSLVVIFGRIVANNAWTGLNAFRNAAGLLLDSAGGEIRYGNGSGVATARSKTLRFGASDAVILYPSTYPGRSVNDNELYRSIDFDRAASGPVLVWDLTKLLPGGVTITQLRVMIKPGAARTVKTSNPGDNGRMFFGLYAFAHDWATPAEASPYSPSYAEDDGTTNVQTMTSGALTYTLARNTTSVHCRVFGGDDATTNHDRIYGLEVVLDDPGYSGVR